MDGSREPGTEPTAVPEGALPDEPLAEAASDAGSAGDGWGEGEKTETVTGREWLSQLQKMIDDVATQAAPVARQVAAKAAELAAAGAAAAGPLAHKAADVTSDVSAKLADRATQLAKDLRSAEAEAAADATNGTERRRDERHRRRRDRVGHGRSERRSCRSERRGRDRADRLTAHHLASNVSPATAGLTAIVRACLSSPSPSSAIRVSASRACPSTASGSPFGAPRRPRRHDASRPGCRSGRAAAGRSAPSVRDRGRRSTARAGATR